jgi:hypothetical protein
MKTPRAPSSCRAVLVYERRQRIVGSVILVGASDRLTPGGVAPYCGRAGQADQADAEAEAPASRVEPEEGLEPTAPADYTNQLL